MSSNEHKIEKQKLSPDKSIRECMHIIRARVAELQNRTGMACSVAVEARDEVEGGGRGDRNHTEYLWDATVTLTQSSKEDCDELGEEIDDLLSGWETCVSQADVNIKDNDGQVSH